MRSPKSRSLGPMSPDELVNVISVLLVDAQARHEITAIVRGRDASLLVHQAAGPTLRIRVEEVK